MNTLIQSIKTFNWIKACSIYINSVKMLAVVAVIIITYGKSINYYGVPGGICYATFILAISTTYYLGLAFVWYGLMVTVALLTLTLPLLLLNYIFPNFLNLNELVLPLIETYGHIWVIIGATTLSLISFINILAYRKAWQYRNYVWWNIITRYRYFLKM